jgi:hypothetical protein
VKVFVDCLEALDKAADLLRALEAKVMSAKLKSVMREGLAQTFKTWLKYFSKSLDKLKSLDVNEFVVWLGPYEDIDHIDDMDEDVKGIEEELNNEQNAIRRELILTIGLFLCPRQRQSSSIGPRKQSVNRVIGECRE